MTKLPKKPIKKKIAEFRYKKGGRFAAGLISNSPHKENELYLHIVPTQPDVEGWEFHLTADEALAIVSVLSETLYALADGNKRRLKS